MSKTNILSLSSKMTEEVIRQELPGEYTAAAKAEITANLLKHADLEEALARVKQEYKEKMEPISKRVKQLLSEVRAGYVDTRMMVHNIPDDDKLIIEFYSQDGEKVGERKMTLDERPPLMLSQIHKNS
jgi:hypothetical protein